MSATRNPTGSDEEDVDPSVGEAPATPDEDGPHDVPDDTVIEKTLPSVPVADDGDGGNFSNERPR